MHVLDQEQIHAIQHLHRQIIRSKKRLLANVHPTHVRLPGNAHATIRDELAAYRHTVKSVVAPKAAEKRTGKKTETHVQRTRWVR